MLISVPELTVESGLKYEVTAKPKILDKAVVEDIKTMEIQEYSIEEYSEKTMRLVKTGTPIVSLTEDYSIKWKDNDIQKEDFMKTVKELKCDSYLIGFEFMISVLSRSESRYY